MSNYYNLKNGNIKFPMSKTKLKYYMSLDFKCFVIQFHQRMDGSVYAVPEILYVSDNIVNCFHYVLFDRDDIRHFLQGDYYDHFKNKYKNKCVELENRLIYTINTKLWD